MYSAINEAVVSFLFFFFIKSKNKGSLMAAGLRDDYFKKRNSFDLRAELAGTILRRSFTFYQRALPTPNLCTSRDKMLLHPYFTTLCGTAMELIEAAAAVRLSREWKAENERCQVYWNYSFHATRALKVNEPDIVLKIGKVRSFM